MVDAGAGFFYMLPSIGLKGAPYDNGYPLYLMLVFMALSLPKSIKHCYVSLFLRYLHFDFFYARYTNILFSYLFECQQHSWSAKPNIVLEVCRFCSGTKWPLKASSTGWGGGGVKVPQTAPEDNVSAITACDNSFIPRITTEKKL